MAYQETRRFHTHPPETDSGALVKTAAVLLGLLVGVLAVVAVLMLASAREAESDAQVAADRAARAHPSHSGSHGHAAAAA